MPKQLIYDHEARQKMFAGIKQLAQAVKMTLGPGGRNVMIEHAFGSPIVTKDGVTVARQIELADPYENMGAQLAREVASKTVDDAGDGTTTATVLAEAIVEEGLRNVVAGANPIGLRDGILKAVAKVTEWLKAKSQPVKTVDDIAHVATIAANGDAKIGRMLAEAIDKTGTDGCVTIEQGRGVDTTIEWERGARYERGFLSPHFITDQKSWECRLEKPLVVVCSRVLRTAPMVRMALEIAHAAGKQIIIFAPEIEGDALGTMILNKAQGIVKSCAVKGPGFGESQLDMLKDIAILTGATYITEEMGLKMTELTQEQMGSAESIIIGKDSTVIINGGGQKEAVEERAAAVIQLAAEAPKGTTEETFRKRAAKLKGGVAKIFVGGATEVEMGELRDRVEDALYASYAANAMGLLPGGGVALARAYEALDEFDFFDPLTDDEKVGVGIVQRALSRPLTTIADNAGHHGAAVLAYVLQRCDFNQGWDAVSGEYKDMMEAGIIDPTKVTVAALTNAASIATLVLTTKVAITDIPEKGLFSPIKKRPNQR